MIDVLGVMTLKANINNPGTDVLWQIFPLLDVYVTAIEVTQKDASDEMAHLHFVDVTSGATVTAGAANTNIQKNHPDTDPTTLLDLGTSKTGHTGSGGSFGSPPTEKWEQKFHVKIGALMTEKPFLLKAGTKWALKFSAAPASSHNWLVKVELTAA